MIRAVGAFALGCVLLSGLSTADAQSPKAKPRLNQSGPTVDEIRNGKFDFFARELKPFAGRTVGPIAKDQDGFEYQYALPDGSRVLFAKCGDDRRCDRVAIVSPTGIPDLSKAEQINKALFAHNQLYNVPGEETRAVVDRKAGLLLAQGFGLNDRTSADYVHGLKYLNFLTALATVKAEFSGEGKVSRPSSVDARSAKPKPQVNQSGPTIDEIRTIELNSYDPALKPFTGQRVGPIRKGTDGFEYEYTLPGGSYVGFEDCSADRRCEQIIIVAPLKDENSGGYRPALDIVSEHNSRRAANEFRYGGGQMILRPGLLYERFKLSDRTPAHIVHKESYPAFARTLAKVKAVLSAQAK